MLAKTAEAAADHFIDEQRLAFSCISDGAVYGSGVTVRREQTLTIWDHGQLSSNTLRLATHSGIGELEFRVNVNYLIEMTGLRAFVARITRYRYAIYDIADRELVIYDWHPAGPSPVITPHLHLPAAGSIILAQRPGNPLDGARTQFGSMYFPTGNTTTSTIIELLIREFRVDPFRSDWERVLQAE